MLKIDLGCCGISRWKSIDDKRFDASGVTSKIWDHDNHT